MNDWEKKEIIRLISLDGEIQLDKAEQIFAAIAPFLGENLIDGRYYIDHVGYCPHCGPNQSICSAIQSLYRTWQVHCGRCGSSSGISKTCNEAIDSWNKRG